MRKKIVFIILLLLLLGSVGGSWYFYGNVDSGNKEVVMVDFSKMFFEEVEEYVEAQGLVLEVDYRYSYEVLEGVVMEQSILPGTSCQVGDRVKVIVSLGEVPERVYMEKRVNEMGHVPIMMYHGIVNQKNQDTEYTGGNVDRDGYQRTVEAFRNDLEFYYQSGYRMIRLMDYIEGVIDVELGYSPIILTFDDGDENNFRVLGEENGKLMIDPDCAVGVLEEFRKKYPDYGVTATFFVNDSLFGQEGYNDKILRWLVSHGYDIGNHTVSHVDFTKIGVEETAKEVGGIYRLLEEMIPGEYVPIVALPFGSPYRKEHDNYARILEGEYLGERYETKGALRVGWEAEVSCFDVDFDPKFLKRIRAYDNLGNDFDIEYNFRVLEKNRYISDGDIDTVVVLEKDLDKVRDGGKRVRSY